MTGESNGVVKIHDHLLNGQPTVDRLEIDCSKNIRTTDNHDEDEQKEKKDDQRKVTDGIKNVSTRIRKGAQLSKGIAVVKMD